MPNFESIENKSRFVQATKPCLYWMCSLLSYCKLFLSFEICSDWISVSYASEHQLNLEKARSEESALTVLYQV